MKIFAMTIAWAVPCPMTQVPFIAYAFYRIFRATYTWADARF